MAVSAADAVRHVSVRRSPERREFTDGHEPRWWERIARWVGRWRERCLVRDQTRQRRRHVARNVRQMRAIAPNGSGQVRGRLSWALLWPLLTGGSRLGGRRSGNKANNSASWVYAE